MSMMSIYQSLENILMANKNSKFGVSKIGKGKRNQEEKEGKENGMGKGKYLERKLNQVHVSSKTHLNGQEKLEQNLDLDSDSDLEESIYQETEQLVKYLDTEIIGKHITFQGPFGKRNCLYLDTIATAQPLRVVETFILNESREIIHLAVGGAKDDLVLFCGSGSTTAVHKLIHCLNIKKEDRPIVFIGPYEHHSNILPWRETGSEMMNVPDKSDGSIDTKWLKNQLKKIRFSNDGKSRPIYAAFSAGSNVTGAVSDDVKITRLIHQYGGLCFWDYACAAPHVKIHMNPKTGLGVDFDEDARKDAIYFSGHKFMGGAQTPGILVAKSHVFQNGVPHGCGGGTSFFVTPERHAYLQNREESEEGGTPGIIESIRLGLVFKFYRSLGMENVIARESLNIKRVLKAISNTKNLIVLGNKTCHRLPIISFLVEHPKSGFYLHHNFVVVLLNDLFGIQCRGGCMCAGPYAQVLLGISLDVAKKYEMALSKDNLNSGDSNRNMPPDFHMIYRPGFTRISLPFDLTVEEIDFIIEAIKMLAKDGWKLLWQYRVSAQTGIFKHLSYSDSVPSQGNLMNEFDLSKVKRVRSSSPGFSVMLEKAQKMIDKIPSKVDLENLHLHPVLNPELESLRWFMMPPDSLSFLIPEHQNQNLHVKPGVKSSRPFTPNTGRYEIKNDVTFSISSINFKWGVNVERKGKGYSNSKHVTQSIPFQLENP